MASPRFRHKNVDCHHSEGWASRVDRVQKVVVGRDQREHNASHEILDLPRYKAYLKVTSSAMF